MSVQSTAWIIDWRFKARLVIFMDVFVTAHCGHVFQVFCVNTEYLINWH